MHQKIGVRAFIALFCLFLSFSTSALAKGELHLKASDFPKDWKLVQTTEGNSETLSAFSKKFGKKIVKVTNSLFNVKGKSIQMNTLVCNSAQDARVVFNRLKDMVGKSNAILRQRTGVVEIITTDKALAEWVIAKIQPEEIHRP